MSRLENRVVRLDRYGHGNWRAYAHPPADQVPDYVAKYAARIDALSWTPASFAADYSVPLRLEIARITGW